MAQNSYFFNAVMQNGEYDREYQASDFARYFFAVLSTGLFHTDNVPAIQASVEAGTLNTVVTPGMAIMKGYLYENTTPVTLTHTLPEVSLDRIDRVVLRLDLRNAERTILLQVKEGVSATYPEARNCSATILFMKFPSRFESGRIRRNYCRQTLWTNVLNKIYAV